MLILFIVISYVCIEHVNEIYSGLLREVKDIIRMIMYVCIFVCMSFNGFLNSFLLFFCFVMRGKKHR